MFFSGKVALPALAVQSRVSRVFRMTRDAPVPAVAQPLSLQGGKTGAPAAGDGTENMCTP